MKAAIASAPRPEKTPLITTILSAPESDSLRVQLFSSPQQTHARMTAREPWEKDSSPVPAVDRMTADIVIRMIAAQVVGVTLSPKTSRAMRVVATISKLLSSETDEAGEFSRPYIRRMGAAMSRTIIPIMYGVSLLVRGRSSARFEGDRDLTTAIPIPAPR